MNTWHLAEPTTSAKGQKSCTLTANGKPVRFELGSRLRTRFGATTLDKNPDATRRSLDFVLDDAGEIDKIDKWTVEYLSKHSLRLFNKELSKEQVMVQYKPLLHEYGEHKSVRTKINLSGLRSCTFWDECKERLDQPENWLDNEYDAFATLAHLYIMGSTFGWVLETTALRIHPLCVECPFISA